MRNVYVIVLESLGETQSRQLDHPGQLVYEIRFRASNIGADETY